MERKTNHRVICFGEVLWDILPSGAVPGGAPMNVTYHLDKLGKNPALITRLGNDEKGKELTDIFINHGVCTDYFQVDENHETGKVYAHPNEHNEVVYDIVKPVAWDFIEYEEDYAEVVSNADYFIFGSLAARSSTSRQTLLKLIEAARNKVLDINLRAPHFDRRIVEELLGKTDMLKLNLSELELITGWFSNFSAIEQRINALSEKFQIATIVVTLGGDGAMMLVDGKIFKHPGFKVEVKDTVGSGDAFLAGILSRIMDGEDPQSAIQFANGLGAFIATKTGACPHYSMNEVKDLITKHSKSKAI